MNAIREKAKRELGEWFASAIKKDTVTFYKFARERLGFKAMEALTFARFVVQTTMDEMMEANFYAGLPH